MSLKIVKYKCYGKAMESEPNKNNIITHKFYWFFFELNTGVIINLLYVENYDEHGKDLGSEHELYYTNDYSFDLKFREWFERGYRRPTNRKIYEVSKSEYSLIVEFYNNNLHSIREVETDVVTLI